MTDKHTISVIIPAYNEIGSLEDAVVAAVATLEDIAREYEIIVVNDGSDDGTRELADRLASEHESVCVIHHEPNRGLGACFKSGYAVARYDFVTGLPGDGQVPAAELRKFVPFMNEADAIVGYYTVPLRHKYPIFRTLLSRGQRVLQRVLMGKLPRTGGNIMFRRSILEGVTMTFDTGFINNEILAQAIRQGRVALPIPVNIVDRTSGESKVTNWATISKTLAEMVRFRLRSGRS